MLNGKVSTWRAMMIIVENFGPIRRSEVELKPFTLL